MRVSFYVSPRSRAADQQLPLIDAITELALTADAAGFASIVLTEHHLSSHNPFQNSLQFASYLAPQLQSAYMAMCTVNPTLHQPLRLVEQCNLLDLLTRGKLLLGLGSGIVDDEYVAFGRRPEDRARLFTQTIEVMLRLWAFRDGDEPWEFETLAERGRIHRAVTPGPHRCGTPLLARATLTEATLVETARRGWASLVGLWDAAETAMRMRPYFDALEGSGHDAATIEIARAWTGTMKWIHVADTDAQASAEIDVAIDRWSHDPTHPGQARMRRIAEAAALTPEVAAAATATADAADDPRDRLKRQAIWGSPAKVRDELAQFADAGIGHVMGMFLRDLDEQETAKRSLDLFVDEVLPAFSSARSQRIDSGPYYER